MGAMFKRPPEKPDPRTGLTSSECRLLRQTWHLFCLENRDYGVLIFASYFVKSPESLSLFPRFCNRPVGNLPNDPKFRAHACSVGYQLTSMVDSTQDPVLLEALIRKNAVAHTERKGVMPEHFRILGQTVIEVLHAMNERRMNKTAIAAWEKLFAYMIKVTTKVYEEEKIQITSTGASDPTAAQSAKADATGSQPNSGEQRRRGSLSPQRSGGRSSPRSKPGVETGSKAGNKAGSAAGSKSASKSSSKAGSKANSKTSTPKQSRSPAKQSSGGSLSDVKPPQPHKTAA